MISLTFYFDNICSNSSEIFDLKKIKSIKFGNVEVISHIHKQSVWMPFIVFVVVIEKFCPNQQYESLVVIVCYKNLTLVTSSDAD